MTEQEYLRIERGMLAAEQSTTPFPIPGEDEIAVVGDPNETKTNKQDFVVTFRLPYKDERTGKILFKWQDIEYHDVFISAGADGKIVKALATIWPFWKKVHDDGGTGRYTHEEKIKLITEMPDEIDERIRSVVVLVLGINEKLREHMTMESAYAAFSQIIEQFPEVVNETDTFFHSSSAGRMRRRPL